MDVLSIDAVRWRSGRELSILILLATGVAIALARSVAARRVGLVRVAKAVPIKSSSDVAEEEAFEFYPQSRSGRDWTTETRQ